jgi:hypothetical protein
MEVDINKVPRLSEALQAGERETAGREGQQIAYTDVRKMIGRELVILGTRVYNKGGRHYARTVCDCIAEDIKTKEMFSFCVGKIGVIRKLEKVSNRLPVRCAVVGIKGGGYDIV